MDLARRLGVSGLPGGAPMEASQAWTLVLWVRIEPLDERVGESGVSHCLDNVFWIRTFSAARACLTCTSQGWAVQELASGNIG